MMNSIVDLKPAPVWKHFYALTQIPRPSGHCEKVTGYIETFGKNLGLATCRDSAGNICIRKPATPGYENKPTVILQSHVDMVPQANSDIRFDFTKDAVRPYIDGEWVKAEGTTLGADNGIGVAATLAVLEATDLQHGPLEGLFTTDEETGMYGALAVRPGFINGKIMLNLDSELDGELYIGCAGGENVSATFRYDNEPFASRAEDIVVKVSLTGLKGGHSGVDIHLGRANANQLMFRFLKDAMQTYDARLISIEGGNLRNAIPREAFATILIDGKEKYERLLMTVDSCRELFNKEFEGIEGKIELKAERQTTPGALKIIPVDVQRKLTHAIVGCPNGVVNMFAKIPGTVETSVNMAIVKSGDNMTEVNFLVRSSSESKKKTVCSRIESVFANASADSIEMGGAYPGWNPNPDSQILKIMEKVFKTQRGYKPRVEVMHAGLECGIILARVPGLDTVSFGPTIQFPHSPDERLGIVSVEKFWAYLTATLRACVGE